MANIWQNYIAKQQKRLYQTPNYLDARAVGKAMGKQYNELDQNYDLRSRNVNLPENVARESQLNATGQYVDQLAGVYSDASRADIARKDQLQSNIDQAQLKSDELEAQKAEEAKAKKAKMIATGGGILATAATLGMAAPYVAATATTAASGGLMAQVPLAMSLGNATENIVSGLGGGQGAKYMNPEEISQGFGEIAGAIYTQAKTTQQRNLAGVLHEASMNPNFAKLNSTQATLLRNQYDSAANGLISTEQFKVFRDNLLNSVNPPASPQQNNPQIDEDLSNISESLTYPIPKTDTQKNYPNNPDRWGISTSPATANPSIMDTDVYYNSIEKKWKASGGTRQQWDALPIEQKKAYYNDVINKRI